ncbi:MAG: Gfo/Idh/MocA family oxidoreductase [Anaerolineales bacterium]|jgi:predicted dehydrogenase
MSVRIAVIGGGIWGSYHLRAARQLERDGLANLVAIAARTEKTALSKADAFNIQGYTDYRRMIDTENLDAVTVATPDHLHREMVLYALEKGKHVLVEKPMDLSTSGSYQMVSKAREKDRLLQVDFHKRYDYANIDARRQVRNGKIGTPYYAYAYMEDKIIVPAEWLSSWAAKSSPFWFIGVHKFDLVRWITGQEAVSVSARGYKGKLSSLGIDTYDAVSASIEMDAGLSCHIDVNWVLPKAFEAVVNQGVRLIGSEGLIEIDSQDRGLRYAFTSDGAMTPNPNAFFNQESIFGGESVHGYFVEPIKDFIRNVAFLKQGGTLSDLEGRYPSGLDGLKVTQLAEAVEMSINTGQAVRVDVIN